jgi:hypothetical protein
MPIEILLIYALTVEVGRPEPKAHNCFRNI